MSDLDPITIAWMVFWVGSCLGVIFLCGYMANRKPSDNDLDFQILQAQARLDELLVERGKRQGRKEAAALRPSFRDLANRADAMDPENQ